MRARLDDELITKRETAAWLRVCPRTIDYWTAGPTPRLPYVKFGNKKCFILGDIRRFIDQHKIRGARAA